MDSIHTELRNLFDMKMFHPHTRCFSWKCGDAQLVVTLLGAYRGDTPGAPPNAALFHCRVGWDRSQGLGLLDSGRERDTYSCKRRILLTWCSNFGLASRLYRADRSVSSPGVDGILCECAIHRTCSIFRISRRPQLQGALSWIWFSSKPVLEYLCKMMRRIISGNTQDTTTYRTLDWACYRFYHLAACLLFRDTRRSPVAAHTKYRDTEGPVPNSIH